MIGMPSAKAFFEETRQLVQFLEAGGNPQILRTSLNMVITGNPGGFLPRSCPSVAKSAEARASVSDRVAHVSLYHMCMTCGC